MPLTPCLVTGSHPHDLADGRQVEPGAIERVDLNEPHNQALADAGSLVPRPEPKPKPKTTTKEGESK